MPQLWLSAEKIAAHHGVTEDAVYAWTAERRAFSDKVGRLWKFRADQVSRWVHSSGASTPFRSADT